MYVARWLLEHGVSPDWFTGEDDETVHFLS
jgi:hypothetical protein